MYKTAYSGECFRFIQKEENKFEVIAFGKVLNLYQKEYSILFDCSENDFDEIWKHYFDLDFNYDHIINILSKGNDNFLKSAAQCGKGIKILNQEPFETIISFIISQQMQIPRIKKSIELISEKYGNKIDDDHYAFPTIIELAKATNYELEEMKLGYRSKYITSTVKEILNGNFDLNKPFSMSYENAKSYLKALKGVGEKVANCILLFAYHKTEAFPIDTWIKKIIAKYYNGNL